LPPLTPIERREFDYTALEEAMAHLDAVVRNSRHALRTVLRTVLQGGHEAEAADPEVAGQD
jgi:hypothetical protein